MVDFREGDAEEVPFPDASFDYVLSTLGAMFTPDQEKTAHSPLRTFILKYTQPPRKE